jgi:hypothetical protein
METSLGYGLRKCLKERNSGRKDCGLSVANPRTDGTYHACRAFCTTQTAYDQFFPEYQKIMELVEYVYPHLVEAKRGEPLYRLNLGIIIAMFVVGVRCWDKATRDSAAHLLNLNDEYCEGMWDTGSAEIIVSWLREIEDGMRDENGEIAEESRAFVTEAHLDQPHRRGSLNYPRGRMKVSCYERRSSLGDGSEKD